MNFQLIFTLLTIGLISSACTPVPPVAIESAPVQQCLVCRHHRDFGCLNITKTAKTPQARYAGRTFWFCSESCRHDFEKNPKRYFP